MLPAARSDLLFAGGQTCYLAIWRSGLGILPPASPHSAVRPTNTFLRPCVVSRPSLLRRLIFFFLFILFPLPILHLLLLTEIYCITLISHKSSQHCNKGRVQLNTLVVLLNIFYSFLKILPIYCLRPQAENNILH